MRSPCGGQAGTSFDAEIVVEFDPSARVVRFFDTYRLGRRARKHLCTSHLLQGEKSIAGDRPFRIGLLSAFSSRTSLRAHAHDGGPRSVVRPIDVPLDSMSPREERSRSVVALRDDMKDFARRAACVSYCNLLPHVRCPTRFASRGEARSSRDPALEVRRERDDATLRCSERAPRHARDREGIANASSGSLAARATCADLRPHHPCILVIARPLASAPLGRFVGGVVDAVGLSRLRA